MVKRRTERAEARKNRTKATKPKGPSKFSLKGKFVYGGTGSIPRPAPFRTNRGGSVR